MNEFLILKNKINFSTNLFQEEAKNLSLNFCETNGFDENYGERTLLKEM